VTEPADDRTTPATTPATTPGAMALRALPRLAVVAVLVFTAATRSGWLQILAVVALLLTALSAGDWARWVRTGARPGAAPAQIPVRYRGDELEVWLEDAGENKIRVIRLVRELQGLGLEEAKELVDNPPARLATGLNEAGAAWVSTPFTAHGARTSLRPAGSDAEAG
jgi:large subunit ribosomal protein L7/L12